MDRRDRIILEKILSEIDMAQSMLSDSALDVFLQNEMLMRASAMTVIS